MRLAPGTRLGPYEIAAPLGAGGMGEVYRAHDTKLSRDVAVKVLPESLSSQPDALARFEREAKAVAALSHPNILAIFDFGSHDGTSYAVMELLEGDTLRARLRGRALGVRKAVEIGLQIVQGLAAAHDKGVMHRDLKPENVFLTRDGGVKILDFGLARRSLGAGDDTRSPTLSLTEPGTVMGTVGYMSPEQVRGQPADHRSDIFAFGAVFHEMLTGRRAFQRETAAETMTAILKDEPPELATLAPGLPPALERIVHHCLEKRPEERFQSARDLAFDLLAHSGSVSGPRAAPPGSWPGPLASFREKRLLAPLAVALVVGLALGIAAQRARQPPARAGGKAWRFSVDVGPGLYLDRPSDPLVALSPDGSLLAYGVYGGFYPQELRLRRMGAIEASPLAGTRRAKNPFFSPDGQWIAYFSFPDQRLLKAPVAGGKPVTICEAPFFWGGAWDVRGNIFFGSLGSIYRVSSAGGKPEVVLEGSTARGKPGYRYPEVLPEGDALLVTAGSEGDDYTNASIVLLDLETRKLRTLVDRGENARYVPTGHLVFVRDGSLMAARFDLRRREVHGTPSAVVPEITHAPRYAAGHYSFSNNGVLAYVPPGTSIPTARVVWRRRDGSTEPIGLSVSNFLSMRLSPDGVRVAISASGTSGKLFVFDLQRGVLAPLTSMNTDASAFELQPVWTPDGQRISFSTAAGDNFVFQIHQARADGSGPVEHLQKGEAETNAYPYAWTPDGRALLYVAETLDKGMNIGLLSPGAHPESKLLLSSEANEDEPALSPDGRWLAYTSDESGRREVIVRPFPDLGAKWQVSSEGGFSPRWSRNGREVFYRDGTHVMVVAVEGGKDFAAGPPRPLFKDSIPPWLNGGYDVSPDGQSLLTMEIEEDGAKRIVVVLDWFEELKRLVPSSR